MCGFFAASCPPGSKVAVHLAVEALQHRGPDDSGMFASPDQAVFLGHARLSIVDLSAAGHQPMADSTGRYVLSYNGEIYNFQDLRADLESRHGQIAWRGGSDSEVIVEGVARDGLDFLERLNGIFALSVYDHETRELHLLRDPLGIKPLVMTRQMGGVFAASEIKSLLALDGIRHTLRRGALYEQLSFMYVPEPNTMFEEFSKVAPGVLLTYLDGQQTSARPMFASLAGDGRLITDEAEAIAALDATFARAVRRQLVADVPVSLFLSGGLDSTAVAYQAVSAGAQVHDAYTIAFSAADMALDAQSDDLRYARMMAERLSLDLKVIHASRDFLSLLPDIVGFMEDGFTDPAAINTYLICAGARKDGIKVMLSGQGADEYLGGYRRYVAEKMLLRIPAPLRGVLSLADTLVPDRVPGALNSLARRVKRFASLAAQDPRQRVRAMYTWADPDQIASLFVEPPATGADDDFYALLDSLRGRDSLDQLMGIDHHYDLMSLNLCYTDRMSMAVGVEARVPFLDFDLVRLMNSIDPALKVKGREGKYIFKKAMEPYLPKEVIYREKAGFGLPIRAWMAQSSDMIDRYFDPQRIRDQGIFRPEAIERLRKEHMSGARDHGYTLLTLLIQQIWLDRFTACDN